LSEYSPSPNTVQIRSKYAQQLSHAHNKHPNLKVAESSRKRNKP